MHAVCDTLHSRSHMHEHHKKQTLFQNFMINKRNRFTTKAFVKFMNRMLDGLAVSTLRLRFQGVASLSEVQHHFNVL